jgi:hypothetical protein
MMNAKSVARSKAKPVLAAVALSTLAMAPNLLRGQEPPTIPTVGPIIVLEQSNYPGVKTGKSSNGDIIQAVMQPDGTQAIREYSPLGQFKYYLGSMPGNIPAGRHDYLVSYTYNETIAINGPLLQAPQQIPIAIGSASSNQQPGLDVQPQSDSEPVSSFQNWLNYMRNRDGTEIKRDNDFLEGIIYFAVIGAAIFGSLVGMGVLYDRIFPQKSVPKKQSTHWQTTGSIRAQEHFERYQEQRQQQMNDQRGRDGW